MTRNESREIVAVVTESPVVALATLMTVLDCRACPTLPLLPSMSRPGNPCNERTCAVSLASRFMIL